MLKEGIKAPSFSVADETGKVVTLSKLKGSYVVLYFYPKDMTSGCTQQACDFQSSLSRFKKKGVVVLGVSRDDEKKHQKFKVKHGLDFPLLVDADGKLCESYGVWKEKSMYGRKYMGIERTTFLIDPNGKILKIFPKVKVTGHIDAILEAL